MFREFYCLMWTNINILCFCLPTIEKYCVMVTYTLMYWLSSRPEHLCNILTVFLTEFVFQKAIQDKYGVPPSKLRIYFHYQPSYYHLHVHFTHVKLEAPGSGVERAHLLTDVINNIKLLPDYYKLKPLMFAVKENDPLYSRFKEAGKL